MFNGSISIYKFIFILFFSFFLSGCKISLYTGLNENEGNEMLSILMKNGIDAEKTQDKDGFVTLKISNSKVSQSIQLLRSNGYPKDKFSTVKDIFPKEGMISSPTEERARYTYSMSQDISATLSMIDGVVKARVHVVLPQETSNILEDAYPSSASVFIKYTPELELSGFVSKVKVMVANSIEGLSLEKITVSLFPASQGATQEDLSLQELDKFLSIRVTAESLPRLLVLFWGLLILSLGLLVSCGYLVWFFWVRQRKTSNLERVNQEQSLVAEFYQ